MKKPLSSLFSATLFVVVCLLSPSLFAQTPRWVELMQDPNAQFEETLAEFNEYWKDRPITKGSGYKPFQRWAWYMTPRVTPEGTQAGPMRTLAAMQRYLAEHPDTVSIRGRNTANGTWQQVGPVDMPANGTGQPNGLGRVNTIAFHPTDAGTIFIGAPAGGIWKSTDYGSTWTNMNNGLTRLGVSSIVVHPTTPTTMYIATGDRDAGDAPGYGVWRTTDGGDSWSAWNTGMGNRTVYEILMDPSNSNILIASTLDRIFRSTDGGATWVQTYAGGEDFKDIAFKPGDPNIVYAASNDLYRSDDNGLSWAQIVAGVPSGVSRIALAVSADQPDYVYLLAGDGAGLDGLYRSTNSGISFTTRSTTPNILGYATTGGTGSQAWYDLVAIGDPADVDHMFASGVNTWESFDGGATWSIVTHWVGSGGNPAVHADHHALEYSPHTGDLFLGHDGGISYSADAGVSWTEISSGLAIAQVYKIGQAQTKRDLVINGYQDNGTAYYKDGSWITEIGGDGMECIIDYGDDAVMYGALYYGDIRRSTNGGNTFSTIADNGTNGITESGAWVTPYKLHPTNPDTMFVGYKNVWRSLNCKSAASNAVSWTQISAFAGTYNIVDIAIAPSNPNAMYVSRDGAANFYSTTNAYAANPTWTDLDASLPASGAPADIEIDPTNPSKLWIALGSNIYQSIDAGVSWADFSGTLPSINLNTIVFDEESPVEAMYVGMDAGVYYRDNTMADWVLFSDGLANVEITELEIYYDAECRGNDLLRASTYGRGLWESDLKDPGNIVPDACFYASAEEVCTGSAVRLEDNSAYTPTAWAWSIAPATFTYENGTNANSQHPEVSFNAQGLYTISLTATNGTGSDLVTRTDYLNVSNDAVSLPLTEDFETTGLCATTTDCDATICALPNGWENLSNGVEDDIDWRTDEGGTPSTGTGPTVDANPGTAVGNYLYLEASSCFGRTARMVSPCIDLSGGSISLSFSYYMEGANMGELHLDIFADGVWTEDIMTPISGDQGANWTNQVVNLDAYAGKVVSLQFRGITGNGFESDIAIDDINVSATATLAVELATFEAEYLETGEVDLRWQTLSETNHDYFSVERSVDGQQFEPLTQVPGVGNSNSLQSYQARDTEPFFGKNFYRLKQFAMDGSITLSDIVEVVRPITGVFEVSEVYPNPADDAASLDLVVDESQRISLQLYNQLGQPVGSSFDKLLTPGSHVLPIEVQQLPAGIYLLRISGKVRSTTRRLLVR